MTKFQASSPRSTSCDCSDADYRVPECQTPCVPDTRVCWNTPSRAESVSEHVSRLSMLPTNYVWISQFCRKNLYLRPDIDLYSRDFYSFVCPFVVGRTSNPAVVRTSQKPPVLPCLALSLPEHLDCVATLALGLSLVAVFLSSNDPLDALQLV